MREEGGKEMSGEERLPEERCRKCTRVIDGVEVRGDDPVEYSSPRGLEVPLES